MQPLFVGGQVEQASRDAAVWEALASANVRAALPKLANI